MKNIISYLFIYVFFLVKISFAQIPSGYYNSAEGLTGEELKTALHNIIRGHNEFIYTSSSTDVWDILKKTDKDPDNPNNVILLYSGWSVNAAQEYNSGSGWSREHVWAKSHGEFGTTPAAGTDVHHLRPADISVNSARHNKDFDIGGSLYIDGDGETQCYLDGDSWEPRDEVKGDVARMIFYMAVRYEGDSGEPDLELVEAVNSVNLTQEGKGFHGKLSALMNWHKEDPVSDFETNRNNVIYSYQNNRNPFIDHPEYVEKIWINPNPNTSAQDKKIFRLEVFPNPANDFLRIGLAEWELINQSNISIYNSLGKKVLQEEVKNADLNINISHLSEGIYFIQLQSKNKIYQSKIIIHRK